MIGLPKPKTWSESPLGEVAEIERVVRFGQNIETGTKYVGLEHLDSEGRISPSRPSTTAIWQATSSRSAPSIYFMANLRPYLRKIVRPDFDGVCSTDILPIRATKVDRGYLFHYLRHPRVVEYATGRCDGANLPRISPSELEKFPCPLPPAPRAAADRGTFSTRPTPSGENGRKLTGSTKTCHELFFLICSVILPQTERLEIIRIEQLLSKERAGTRCGPFGTALKKHEYVSHGIPVWGIENVLPRSLSRRGIALHYTIPSSMSLTAYSVGEWGYPHIASGASVGRVCVARPKQSPSIIGTNLIREFLLIPISYSPNTCRSPEYFPNRVGSLRASSDDDAYSFMKTGVLTKLNIPVPPSFCNISTLRFTALFNCS